MVVAQANARARKWHCPCQHIDCSIMVSMEHKAATYTAMLPDGERLLHALATPGAILRCELRRNLPYPSASTLSLADEYLQETVPRRVTDGLRQAVIPENPFDVQIFDRNIVKLSDESIAQFVK